MEKNFIRNKELYDSLMNTVVGMHDGYTNYMVAGVFTVKEGKMVVLEVNESERIIATCLRDSEQSVRCISSTLNRIRVFINSNNIVTNDMVTKIKHLMDVGKVTDYKYNIVLNMLTIEYFNHNDYEEILKEIFGELFDNESGTRELIDNRIVVEYGDDGFINMFIID